MTTGFPFDPNVIDHVFEAKQNGEPNWLADIVVECLEQLTDLEQDVLSLRYFGQFGKRGTARALRIGDDKERKIEVQALERLRVLLEEHDITGFSPTERS